MDWAKFIDENKIEYANPKRLVLADKQIFNPKEADFISNGFYSLIEVSPPKDELAENQYWCAKYIFKNNKIIQNWQIKEDRSTQS